MNSASRALKRRHLVQRRLRTQLNTIHNLVDDLLEALHQRNEPLNHEETQRLLRLSTVLRSIYTNRGILLRHDFEEYLSYQQAEFEQLLSETSSWHTCPSETENA